MPWSTNPLVGAGEASLAGAAMPSNSSNALWNNFLGGFINKGKDVGNIKLFQPTLLAGQSQGRQIAESSGYGDQALMKSQGGTNANIVNEDTRIAQANNQTNTANAIANLANQGLQEGSQYEASQAQMADELALGKANIGAQGIAENSQYTQSPWASFLPNLLSSGASAAMSFI